MKTKKCSDCGTKKPTTQFYKNRRMADGLFAKCKKCVLKECAEYRRTNLEKVRAADRLRGTGNSRRIKRNGYVKTWREKNPRKYAAQVLLNNAIRAGKVTRQPCRVCGEKAQAHHENYDKPLEVVWFCAVHHVQRHKEMKQFGIEP
jgi:hypothetical protein